MFSTDQLIQVALFAGMFLLISGPIHECAHAFTAWKLGDGTAKLFGRVTLNPIVQFDSFGALMIVIAGLSGFGLGWAKPTPVNPYNLRGRYGDSIVAAAGPVSNLALAAVFGVLYRVIPDQAAGLTLYIRSPAGIVSLICLFGVVLNVGLFLFNLLPIPPLDGSHVLFDLLDPQTARQIRPVLQQYGILILFLVIFPFGQTSIAGIVMDRVGFPIMRLFLGW